MSQSQQGLSINLSLLNNLFKVSDEVASNYKKKTFLTKTKKVFYKALNNFKGFICSIATVKV